MPGRSFAPILAAVGAFSLFLGLVFGGVVLIVGAIVLAVTLLYWLAEAVRIYDHDLGETATALPVVDPRRTARGRPHARTVLPPVPRRDRRDHADAGPGLRRVAAGRRVSIALIATLLGWLVDARKEYVKTVEADTTGHLENIPPPRTPSLLLASLAILLVGAMFIQAGWIPPREASGGEGATPSGEPGSPPAGPDASEAPAGPEADIVLTAFNIAFDKTEITGPADAPFTIALINDDAGTPHNVEFLDSSGTSVWKGEIFNGVETRVYEVPALPAGTYTFLCTVHPSMTGTATLQ